jgi:hypothetical protein
MEEADKILLHQLGNFGVKLTSLDQFTAQTFITVIINCFEKISEMLVEEDNFI